MDISVGFVCDRGLNPKRPVNQDRYLALADRGIFAVFDGVGGQRAGEVASQTAADTVEEAVTQYSSGASIELVRRAIQFANRDIFELAESDAAFKTMATTVALIHIDGDHATVAHVGDSRVYRLEGDSFYRETIDHTDHDDELRNGGTPPGSLSTPHNGNVINRALGMETEVDVEIKSIRLRDGARFLLCSDGIYRHLADDEIAGILAQSKDPQSAADEMKSLVYQRGAEDNLTAVVVQVGRTQRPRKPATMRAAGASGVRKDRGKPIEVEFRNADRPADVAPTGHVTRRLMYVLIVLVLIAGAFYGGLRASDLVKGPQEIPGDSSRLDALAAGKSQFQIGNYREAVELFTSATTREPQNHDALYWLGRAQLELGEYAAAAESFDKAGGVVAEANLYGAAAHRAAGNKVKAEELLDRYNEQRKQQRRSR